MIKKVIEQNESKKVNDREIAVLRAHFPACFKSDGCFDMERFKGQIKEKVDVVHEGYELNFLGKSYAKLLASVDTTTVVQPNMEHNQKPENKNSENIYISGDNLDGLKHLLKSYSKTVSLVFIDPPYNTGTDGFIYNDRFNFTVDELTEKLSIDETQAQRILNLTKKGSASHSAWLMFMYPRLQLARDLLVDEGVIFISIDDNEHANLKCLCDDIFGEENCLGVICWKKKTNGNNMGTIPPVHDFILSYARDKSKTFDLGYNLTQDDIDNNYSNPDNHPRGPWATMDLSANHVGPYFAIKNPVTGEEFFPPEGRYWVFNEEEVKKRIEDGRIIFGKSGSARPVQRVFACDRTEKKRKAESWWDNHGMNEDATTELRDLFGIPKVFVHPKPTKLLSHIIQIASDRESLIVDFFSGSGTTAHAVMQQNTDDGGKRKYIMIQLPELCKDDSEAKKAGYKTIDEIGIDRIINAAKKLKEDRPDADIDYGFKHFTLLEPKEQTLDKLMEFNPDIINNESNNILDEFGRSTVLATWLVGDGYGLSVEASPIDLGGYTAYHYDKHLYLVDADLTADHVVRLFEKYDSDGDFNPENIVLFGYSFTDRKSVV